MDLGRYEMNMEWEIWTFSLAWYMEGTDLAFERVATLR
jgi:hypothetical protein